MAGRTGVTVYIIGPEGGFSARELDALRAAGFTAEPAWGGFCVVSSGHPLSGHSLVGLAIAGRNARNTRGS